MQGFFYGIQSVEVGGYPVALLIVILLLIFLKKHRSYTKRVLVAMNLFKLVCSSVSFILFAVQLINAWYSANAYERGAFQYRIVGPYWWSYWTMMIGSFLVPQLFWYKRLRTNILISLFCAFSGSLFELFIIVVTSYYRDNRPAAWSAYQFTGFATVVSTLILYALCVIIIHAIVQRFQGKRTITS